ncbi:hypothetical protein D3C86_1475890 [compost metagenome]
MASSLFPDPLQLWREALTKLEGEVNALATGSTQSQEAVRSLHQFSSASQGVQQMVEKAIGAYLRRANLPSRKEMLELAQSLQRIEEKVDRLLPPQAPAVPRPARTRRPSGAAQMPKPAASAPGPIATPAPRSKRRAAPRAKG